MERFNQIVALLDSRTVFEEVTAPLVRAREGFLLGRSLTVSSSREFRQIAADFYKEMMRSVTGGEALAYHAEAEVMEIIMSSYGSRGGLRGAYEIASGGGMSAGLRDVLESIMKAISDRLIANYTRHIMHRFVDPLQFDDKVALVMDYLRHTVGAYQDERQIRQLAYEYANNYEALVARHLENYNMMAMQGLIQRPSTDVNE